MVFFGDWWQITDSIAITIQPTVYSFIKARLQATSILRLIIMTYLAVHVLVILVAMLFIAHDACYAL